MRYTEETLETLVYYTSALAIALGGLSSVAVDAQAEALEEERSEEVLFVEFSPNDLLRSQILALEISGAISLYAEVVEETSPLEQYRNRTEALSHTELRELLSLTGFSGKGLRTAWAVAMRESTGNPLAHNTNSRTRDNSYGLFQINMFGTLESYRQDKYDLRSNDVLFDPVRNAEIAFQLSKQGTDFGHWNVGPNAYRGDGSPPGYERWLPEYPEE